MRSVSSVCLSVCIRDDAFSDSIQRPDSEARSVPHHDERAPSRNDHQSPCEHTPEHRFGAALGRWGLFKFHGIYAISSERGHKRTHNTYNVYMV